MTEFLHMGGYAFYVWSAYAVTAAALVVVVIVPLRRRARMIRELGAIAAQQDNLRPL
ncbi:MAG TPA: heme exporter protein CcmD [Gammaproteobacteria bacterium]|nr:heme exporter protein CcmD [Gammaproteobacteria bacterium]